MSCETHQLVVTFHPVELARKLGDLRYDALVEYLEALSAKIGADSDHDLEGGRDMLAMRLTHLSNALLIASQAANEVWELCKPHMAVK